METNPEADQDSQHPTQNGDALAKALSATVCHVIRDFDTRAHTALQSKHRLSSAVDRLTNELDRLLEDAPVPIVMQHVAKISGVRKRVVSLNLLLRNIQERIDNVDRMLSAGLAQEKAAAQRSYQSWR